MTAIRAFPRDPDPLPCGRDGGRPAPVERRVLIIAPQPFFEVRGTPIAISQVITALLELGYGVDLVTYPIGETLDRPGLRYFRGANPFGFRFVPIGLSLRKVILDLALIPQIVRRLRHAYSYIHAVEEAAFIAALVTPKSGPPILYDMQSAIPEQLATLPGGGNRLVQGLLRRAESWMIERSTVVGASKGLGGRVATRPVREWQFASDVGPSSATGPDAAKRRLGLFGRPLVVYAGSFAPYQGIPMLIDAIPLVIEREPDTQFLVAGGRPSEVEETERKVAAMGLSGSVTVLPQQPRSTVAGYLAAADVLVSPRVHGDNLPLKVFDYLATGRAVVATDLPCHRAVLDETTSALVHPSPHGLAEAILELLGDDERRSRMAAAARTYAAEELGWGTFVNNIQELLGLLEAATGNGAGRTR